MHVSGCAYTGARKIALLGQEMIAYNNPIENTNKVFMKVKKQKREFYESGRKEVLGNDEYKLSGRGGRNHE